MYNVCHHHLKLTTEENYYSNNNYNNKLLNCLQRAELLLNYLNIIMSSYASVAFLSSSSSLIVSSITLGQKYPSK